jgi:protein SEY1
MQLAGMLSLSTKFVPTVMNILKKLAEEGQRPNEPDQQQRGPGLDSKIYGNGVHNTMSPSSSSTSSNVTSSDGGIEISSSLKQ